jgi:hypothetical protein
VASLRARLKRWFRPPRKFRLTREGKWFIGATLVLGFRRGQRRHQPALPGVRHVAVPAGGQRRAGRGVHAPPGAAPPVAPRHLCRQPLSHGHRRAQHKKRVATFSLEVEDLSADRHPVDRRCFFLKIPAGRRQETSYRRTLARRGIHRLTGLRLSTRFPFGLLAPIPRRGRARRPLGVSRADSSFRSGFAHRALAAG